eukprot:TRINITY_DN2773_c0_g1_i1.p1 TRINITY_DN2773_c0_g1~~TRINITY_DN2773_c0_g1_i1.p1  ORF type:complete len:234 (-),score=43.36 TRINITY_DN2773_c0_g1_i1:456-1106(-)
MSTLPLLIAICLIASTTSQNTKIAPKQLLSEAAKNEGAVCIDGSPPAYYYWPGEGDGANHWYIHHQGGGWCYDSKACFSRSKTQLGSSKNYPDSVDLSKMGGYFSGNPSINPMMHNWNTVFLRYCDGGSFSGDREEPDVYQGSNLFYRGFRVLKAVKKDLEKYGLDNSSNVVISGCSAGGLATYLHLDWWSDNLPNANVVVGLPDSGFFCGIWKIY